MTSHLHNKNEKEQFNNDGENIELCHHLEYKNTYPNQKENDQDEKSHVHFFTF